MTNSEKVAYLKGLFEGMGLSSEEGEGKIISGILDVLTDMAGDVADLEDNAVELGDELDSVSADVAALESVIYDEDDEDDEDDDDDDEDGDGLIEYECPHCGTVIFFDEEAFDMEEEHLCPNCHRKVFEEDEEPNGEDDE